MLIYHGEDQVTSRNAYLSSKLKLKDQDFSIQDLAADDLTLPDLKAIAETVTLFGQPTAVFIEGLFSRRPSNDKKALLDYLQKNSDQHIILWEPKDVSSLLKTFEPQIIKKFDLPKHIFNFLDSLDLASFHRCLETLPAEQLLASIATRIHKVMLGQGRFNLQFSQAKLKNLNQSLLQIDYLQKTSKAPYDLASALELWLIKNVHS